MLPALREKIPSIEDNLTIRVRPSTMRMDVYTDTIPANCNIREAVQFYVRAKNLPVGILRIGIVHVDGMLVPREHWEDLWLKEGQFVTVVVPTLGGGGGGGGKNIMKTVLSLVVVAAAAVATWYVGGLGAFEAGGVMAGWGGVAGAIAGAAVMMGGMLLVNALCPASTPKLSGSSSTAETENAAKIWSIDGAQNKADPYGVVPTVMGSVRYAPRHASKYYSVLNGNDQYVRYLYVVSTGSCEVDGHRIGDTNFWNYEGCELYVYKGWTGQGTRWFNQARSEESFSIAVKNSVGWVTRTTAKNTVWVELVLVFNEGLKHIDKEGHSSAVTVNFQVRYRRVGASDWTMLGRTVSCNQTINVRMLEAIMISGDGQQFPVGIDTSGNLVFNGGTTIAYCTVSAENRYDEYGDYVTVYNVPRVVSYTGAYTGTLSLGTQTIDNLTYITITANGGTITFADQSFSGCTINPQRRGICFDLPEGQYEVSLLRTTPDNDVESTEYTHRDACTWTALQSARNKPAVVGDPKHPLTIVEMQIKASEQLSGSVDEYNCMCTSDAPIWNGSYWYEGPTSNPASLALRVATGTDIGKPASWSEMDLESYKNFYNWCEAYGWKYNSVITSRTTAAEIVHNIFSSGRGSYALLNGHGVIWDDPNAAVSDMLTPRNSWSFQSKKTPPAEIVQGLRMRFLNQNNDYQEDEMVVYLDGYNADNATNIIEWEQDGVTDPNLIWKHGRLRLAEMRLRPEVYTLSCEAESVTMRRGDRVRVVHDATFWGICSGSIVKVNYTADGSLITGIELDEYCDMTSGKSYGVRITNALKTDAYYSVVTQGNTSTRSLTFSTQLDPSSCPMDIGDLVGFGISTSVGAVLAVLSVSPQTGFTAQVTFCDAAPEIYQALTGAIPEWNSQITKQSRYQVGAPNPPVILNIISDEAVLRRNADGSLSPQMEVTFTMPDQPLKVKAYGVVLFVRLHGSQEKWQTYTTHDLGDTATVTDPTVTELAIYDVKGQITTDTGLVSEFSETVQHKVIGKTNPPPDITGLTIAIESPLGVRLKWDECTVLDFDHYIVEGINGGKTIANTILCPVPNYVGTVAYTVVAVDDGGRKSLHPAKASIQIYPPAAPDLDGRIVDNLLHVVWQDCTTTWAIRKYYVTDVSKGETTEAMTTRWPMPTRVPGVYQFSVYAEDVFGNKGDSTTESIIVNPMSTPSPTVSVEGTQCVISWEQVVSPFEISYYEIKNADGLTLDKVKATSYRFTAPASGVLGYRVRAVDIAGNMSSWGEVAFDLQRPYAPHPIATIVEDRVEITWEIPVSMLPITGYDIVRQWEEVNSDGILETREYDYGRQLATKISENKLLATTHTFLVRAVDSSGNLSDFGSVDVIVTAPGKVTFTGCYPLDNNAMVYWTEPKKGTFPIERYLFGYVDEDGYDIQLGYTSALFTTIVETKGGDYTYWVIPVDTSGNRGVREIVTLSITQPPEFKLYYDVDSTFSGTKVNMLLDGKGSMVGPYTDETWNENIDAVAAALKIDATAVTWQVKIDNGYYGYLSPMYSGIGSYTEVMDVGAEIPSCRIVVTPTQEVIEGDPITSCKIESSRDNQTWETCAEDGYVGISDAFRYIRISMTWKNGGVDVKNLHVQCAIKKKQDFGTVNVKATDNGTGYETDNMLIGKEVLFNLDFIDVEEPIHVYIEDSSTGKTPIVIFKGENKSPTSFRVAVFDKNGVRCDGTVQWRAQGV